MPAPKRAKPITTPRKQSKQSKLNLGTASNGKGENSKTPIGKKKPANGNILNFFQKIEVEEQLFLGGSANTSTSVAPSVPTPAANAVPTPPKDDDAEDLFGDGDTEDVPEETRSPKRRKLSSNGVNSPLSAPESNDAKEMNVIPEDVKQTQIKRIPRKKGGFLIDSDSEDDNDDEMASSPMKSTTEAEADEPVLQPEKGIEDLGIAPIHVPKLPIDESCPEVSDIPPIKQEESICEEFKDLEDVEGLFDDIEEFDDGEEFRERRYMEEQARLEAEEAGNYTSDGVVDDFQVQGVVESCPLCSASLAGITPEQATIHVNACLDGNPIPLPKPEEPPPPLDMVDAQEVSKRFSRAAVPRPGQANPINVGGSTTTTKQPTSAFSKLMSGHAEDAAWATAAASEHASRGKPAYQRTCPFYKIMPGLSICVDAFRYGAVKGCNAYFLSHFHSDHYIGLTASWSHGPIYCSKVTGSLVKNQLKTAAKWVKELEFEETVEVPGTEGVMVTMIPANHCPGSSLFLFEKTIGKGPKKQRILHCGDFRACQAHVNHSLLKPETIDSISGKVKQQKIDVCYLDTTYLNPRYSFPPQDDVITACAEFCKSLAGESDDADEALDSMSHEKGSVSKFFQKQKDASSSTSPSSSTTTTKTEPQSTPKQKKKGRLLVICGTYSIGKERICKAIAQALDTKIFASKAKIKICQQLGDPALAALMTSNPLEAQVHMQMLMELRADTLQEYLDGYRPHFSRIVGFRPSGWSYRNGGGNNAAKNVPANVSPATVPTVAILNGPAWRTRFSRRDLVAQRGSTRQAMCFGVPYSEHSSFRELALFCMALHVEKVVPTVNVGSEASRKRMKGWIDRWLAERRKGGVVRVLEGEEEESEGCAEKKLWDGKDGKGGWCLVVV